jgi:hypothetical protein
MRRSSSPALECDIRPQIKFHGKCNVRAELGRHNFACAHGALKALDLQAQNDGRHGHRHLLPRLLVGHAPRTLGTDVLSANGNSSKIIRHQSQQTQSHHATLSKSSWPRYSECVKRFRQSTSVQDDDVSEGSSSDTSKHGSKELDTAPHVAHVTSERRVAPNDW